MTAPTGRRTVGVLYGGRSAEHDVSCASGLSVLRAVDPEAFDTVAVGITAEGRFVLPSAGDVRAAMAADPSRAHTAIEDRLEAAGEEVRLVPSKDWGRLDVVSAGSGADVLASLDVVFPVLHGPYGEDGTIQGMLELFGVPFVGSGVLGSAVGMDKVAMKRALRAENLPVGPYHWFHEEAWRGSTDPADVVADLGLPLFVKPANLGSSIGISRVDDAAQLPAAVDEALLYDDVVVVEAALPGREIECGVLGGRSPQASVPGEIVVSGGFYDYAAKYLDGEAAVLHIPADLPTQWSAQIRRLAVAAFEAVGCWGLARVDFFCDPEGRSVHVNEVNTLPGFTSISMYSKMWAATGRSYPSVVAELIDLAFERHALVARRSTRPPDA